MKYSTLLTLFSFALLSACGGGSNEIVCDTYFWDGDIGVCVPDGWHTVEREELDSRGVPPEVIVGFQADQPVSGQFPTMTVTLEPLTEVMSAADYSEASITSVQALPAYEEVDMTDVSIGEDDVTIHEFTAQPQEGEPASRFFQLSTIGHDAGYSFTGATPMTVPSEVEAQIRAMLESVTFEEPGGEG